MRSAKDFFRPLAVGAPTPLTQVPARPSRVIHFFDPSNPRMATKVPGLVGTVDVLLGNLEDAVRADRKEAARAGLVEIAKATDFGDTTQLWTRINSLDSPWGLDDLITLVTEIGDKLDVIMVPKVQGAEDIHYVDRLLAQLEAKAGLTRPILVHAILETARGMVNVEEICGASPRMQGLSLGPADLAADRRMKTTRVGGGHPGYLVRQDPTDGDIDGQRTTYQQDLWHYTIARMVDACAMHGIYPYYGPFGDIADVEEICGASPRMQGLSLGPADLAADRRMKTTRVGGGHPGYLVRQDAPRVDGETQYDAERTTYQQDLWHYTIARMVDACAMHGIYPYYGPFGDISDTVGCEDQFRNAFLLGCVGAWSLHPVQIKIANRVFSPSVEDITHARRVVAALQQDGGDGTGAVMLDGKMEDDASVKQCQVMARLAEELAAIDPELKQQYDAIPDQAEVQA